MRKKICFFAIFFIIIFCLIIGIEFNKDDVKLIEMESDFLNVKYLKISNLSFSEEEQFKILDELQYDKELYDKYIYFLLMKQYNLYLDCNIFNEKSFNETLNGLCLMTDLNFLELDLKEKINMQYDCLILYISDYLNSNSISVETFEKEFKEWLEEEYK